MHKVKRKVFKIPDAVILDKIKAMFNEEDSVLTISMPKAMKGIRGIGVEEVKEEQVVDKIDTSGPKQVTDIVQEVEGEKEIQERGNQEKEQERKDDDVEAQNGLKKTRKEVCLDEPPEREKEKTLGDEATQGNQPPEKRSMICAPVIAGSAFLVSIIVLVIHLNRKKNPPRKSEN